jgi:glycosyltransferase involved in cell wall biosynthesis
MANFSIITVCLNSETTILHTIQSLKSQSIKDYEHIIIDGGSIDSTISIITSQNDDRIILKPQESKGIYGAMNEGIKLATGKFIGVLNSDDFYSNNQVLQIIKDKFETLNVDIVHGNIAFVKQDNISKVVRYWRGSEFKNDTFKNGWHPPHPSFYMSKKGYLSVGYYREDLPVSSDFDLMLRAFEVCKLKSAYLDNCFVTMRLGGESTGSLLNIIKGNIGIAKSFSHNNIKIGLFYFLNRIIKKLFQKHTKIH